MITVMIVTWATVLVTTAILEIITRDCFAGSFTVGALVALILAACRVGIYWQIGIFLAVTIIGLCLRPWLKRLMKKSVVAADEIPAK